MRGGYDETTNRIYLEVDVCEVSLKQTGYLLVSEFLFDDKDFEEILDLLLSTKVLDYKNSYILSMRVCGHTMKEIGEQFGISIASVEKRLKKNSV